VTWLTIAEDGRHCAALVSSMPSKIAFVASQPLGFFSQGVFSGMGPVLTELYPTRMRGSGQGFTYNFGRGIAAMNPLLVGMLSAVMPLGQSIGIFAVIAYGLLTGAALLLPETKGRVLTTEAA
jgi:hypothetical protein